jgi:hypothetical protein
VADPPSGPTILIPIPRRLNESGLSKSGGIGYNNITQYTNWPTSA